MVPAHPDAEEVGVEFLLLYDGAPDVVLPLARLARATFPAITFIQMTNCNYPFNISSYVSWMKTLRKINLVREKRSEHEREARQVDAIKNRNSLITYI